MKPTIKLVKAKTCEGCRALGQGQGRAMSCDLRFKVNNRYIASFGVTFISPAEPCYKPKTIAAYLAALEYRRLYG